MARTARLLTGLVLFGIWVACPGAAAAQTPPDWDLPRGHFYTQAGGDTPRADDGFLVADRPGFGFPTGRNFVRFWSEFGRYGGVAIVGYPSSRPFAWDGFDVQVFQKGVLQWQPDQVGDGRARFMNVFDEFTRRGLDERLLAEQQVPLPGTFEDRGKSFEQIMTERLALLQGHSAMLQQYWSVPDPVALYGLPTSAVQDFGPFSAVRLQRAAFQEWHVDAPGVAQAGQVTVLNGGDLAKAYGLVPASAAEPLPPPVFPSQQVAVYTPGVEESVGSPFTIAGDARTFEAALLWELTDAHGDVLGRGAAAAQSCCDWSSFEADVPFAVRDTRRGRLAVWGASGRDAAERPGEVRIPLELRPGGRPPAARDGQWVIEPLAAAPGEGGAAGWLVSLRVRNESSGPGTLAAAEFGLRDDQTGAVEWSGDTGTTWEIGPGEARDVRLLFAHVDRLRSTADLRLVHRIGQAGDSPSAPVVIALREPETAGGSASVGSPTNQPQPIQAAIADAARQTGLAPAAIQLVRAERREWRDSSLGCPQPGMAYLQVVTPGWLVELRAGRRTLEYHTDARGRAVLCAEAPLQ